jgi:hypothetical protein
MKKIAFSLIITILPVVAAIAQKIGPDDAKQDLSIFRKSLEETHPGLYRFTTKQWFDSAFTSTDASIKDSLTEKEFYQILAPLVARIKCGHTKFFPQSDVSLNQFHYFYDTTKLFPLKLFFTDNKVFVAGSYKGNPDIQLNGTEILTINGEPLDKIREKLMKFIPADGNVLSSKYLELNNYFPAWYANFMNAPDSFSVEMRMQNGSTSQINLKTVSLSMINQEIKARQYNNQANFSLDFPENNIALMKIRNFYPLSPADDYKKFLEEAFLRIKSSKTAHLIIDLRDNEGGMDRWGAMLYGYLTDKKFSYYKELRLSGVKYSTEPHLQKPKFFGILKLLVRKKDEKYYWTRHKNLKIQQPQRNTYTGKVYVLLNGNSYSVTAEFAAIAKSNNRALFFGQETGGTYEGNNSGTFAFVKLPNSKLTLALPMLAYYLDVTPVNPRDRGILPDYYIPPVLDGKDKEPGFVIDFIRNNH